MNRTRSSLLAALAAGAVLVWCSAIRAQDKPQPSAPQSIAPAATLPFSGSWHFNPDLSSDVSALPGQGDRSGSANRPTGGYGGRGGGSSRGGFGGRGGGTGGGGYPSSNVSAQDQAQMDGLRTDVMRHTERLDIVEHETDFTLTSSDGVVRKFSLSGKDEDVAIGTTSAKCRSTRDGSSIVQELQAGPLKIRRTFQTTLNGQLLIVSVKSDASGNAGPGGLMIPFKLIYQRPVDSTPAR